MRFVVRNGPLFFYNGGGGGGEGEGAPILASQHTIFLPFSSFKQFFLSFYSCKQFFNKKFMNFCTKGSFHALMKDHPLVF